MTHPTRRWRPPTGVVALLAVALVVVPLPALAADSPPQLPSPPAPSLLAQAQAAAATAAPAVSAHAASARMAQTPAPTGGANRDRWSFFKSPVGVAVVVGLAAGVGYALYSTQNDRINSPGKE